MSALIHREYFIAAVRLKYMKLHEIFQLDLFDVRDGKAVRSIRGCLADGNITELYVNMVWLYKIKISFKIIWHICVALL